VNKKYVLVYLPTTDREDLARREKKQKLSLDFVPTREIADKRTVLTDCWRSPRGLRTDSGIGRSAATALRTIIIASLYVRRVVVDRVRENKIEEKSVAVITGFPLLRPLITRRHRDTVSALQAVEIIGLRSKYDDG